MKKILSIVFLLAFSQIIFSQNLTFRSQKTYPEVLSNLWAYVDELGNEYALVGVYNGTSVVNVTNPDNPVEIAFIPGPNSIWKEIKTFGDYAYVGNETGSGMQIIDLSPLPSPNNQPITLSSQYFTAGGLNTIHTLFVDENGILYLFGTNLTNGGARLYDLNISATNPPFIGQFSNWYIHDGFVRNDTAYFAHIYNGFMTIVDFTDKANPVLLGQTNTPNNFTHNLWPDDNGDFLFSTDEVDNAFIGSYDITDFTDLREVDRIQTSPGSMAIPHNTYYKNGYLVTSYYTQGITIHDAFRPNNLVEIGKYDTSPLYNGGGFNGCWGVYPYLPSGTIIASDIEEGLYVLTPNYQRAAYLEGLVLDSICQTPITNATILISQANVSTSTDINGEYRTGYRQGGNYIVTISAPGYQTKIISNVQLTQSQVTNLNINLFSPSSSGITGTISGTATGNIQNASVVIFNNTNSYNFNTNNQGYFSRCNIVSDNYSIQIGKWGYETICQENVTIGANTNLTYSLVEGYYDDFNLDFGWTVSGNATAGIWTRAIPNGTSFNNAFSNPNVDVAGDCSEYAFVTGNNPDSGAGTDDVDGGVTILSSPVFDLTTYAAPIVKYALWFFNNGGNSAANDTMIVKISNGSQTVILEKVLPNSTQSQWIERSFWLKDIITLTNNMKLIVEVADYDPGHLVEGGFDKFRISESLVSVDEFEKQSVNIYPNPSNQQFFVQTEFEVKGYRIFDLTGKVLESKENINASNFEIGKNLESGHYFLQLTNSENKTFVQKLIKSH